MKSIQEIKYSCLECNADIKSIEVFSEQVPEDTSSKSLYDSLYHGYKNCPHCNSDNLTVSLGEFIDRSDVSIPSIGYSIESNRAIKKLNNGSKLKEKLQQIHENTPGSTLNRTSNIIDIR